MDKDWEISEDCATPVEALEEHGLDAFGDTVAQLEPEQVNPEGLTELHRRLRRQALKRADRAYGLVLIWLIASTNFDRLAARSRRDTDPTRRVNKGLREVSVQLPSGCQVPLEVTYLLEKPRRRAGRPKDHGNRSETGSGCYPALEAMGVDSHRRLCPLIEEAIVDTGTACDNFRTGWKMAGTFGFEMSWKAYWSRFCRLAVDVRAHHDRWLETERGEPLIEASRWHRRRVVIAADGGRTRLRRNYAGRPQANGWRRFDAEWREPKLMVIYAIDEHGEPVDEPEPIIDGTFGDADACFERLERTLTALRIWEAEEVVFLGDGASWIWKRARPMLQRLGVHEESIREGIDYYHAAGTLCSLSQLPDWGQPARVRWRLRAKEALDAGDIDEVVAMIDDLADRPGAEDAADKKSYFKDNAERMQYHRRRQANLPEGSGAIESAIRRVVNLRMKSNAKYWKEEHAEAMLTLRSHLKTGRLDRLLGWWSRRRCRWWTDTDRRRIRTSPRRRFGANSPDFTRKVA